jgi:hypothetical protein
MTQPDRMTDHERLTHRVERMERVVRELRRRAEERRRGEGLVPAPLGHAIAGFERELRLLRARRHPRP